MPGKLTFEARLVGSRPLTPFSRELEFERLDGQPSQHRAGQFVTMVLPPKDEDGRIDRAYSFAAPPDGTPRFKVMVTRVDGGLGSGWLLAARPGALVPMRGPSGTFVRDAEDRPTLFVTSGSGLCPVRALVQAALASGAPRAPLWLLIGARNHEDLPYREDVEAWSRTPGVRVELSLSQPPPGWTGRTGHVQAHLPELWEALHAQHPEAMVYVAGWKRMVWPVEDVLRRLAVDRRALRVEVFDPDA